jgi:hypothetical protein
MQRARSAAPAPACRPAHLRPRLGRPPARCPAAPGPRWPRTTPAQASGSGGAMNRALCSCAGRSQRAPGPGRHSMQRHPAPRRGHRRKRGAQGQHQPGGRTMLAKARESCCSTLPNTCCRNTPIQEAGGLWDRQPSAQMLAPSACSEALGSVRSEAASSASRKAGSGRQRSVASAHSVLAECCALKPGSRLDTCRRNTCGGQGPRAGGRVGETAAAGGRGAALAAGGRAGSRRAQRAPPAAPAGSRAAARRPPAATPAAAGAPSWPAPTACWRAPAA